MLNMDCQQFIKSLLSNNRLTDEIRIIPLSTYMLVVQNNEVFDLTYPVTLRKTIHVEDIPLIDSYMEMFLGTDVEARINSVYDRLYYTYL